MSQDRAHRKKKSVNFQQFSVIGWFLQRLLPIKHLLAQNQT